MWEPRPPPLQALAPYRIFSLQIGDVSARALKRVTGLEQGLAQHITEVINIVRQVEAIRTAITVPTNVVGTPQELVKETEATPTANYQLPDESIYVTKHVKQWCNQQR